MDCVPRSQIVCGTEVAMLSSIFQSSSLPVLEQVVNFTEARHGVLAGNIANLDTPGYKTRDLSPALFEERLKEAVETKRHPEMHKYEGDPFASPAENAKSQQSREMAAFRKVENSM